MPEVFDDELFRAMAACTRAAGDLALGYFCPGQPTTAGIDYKTGNSPVTIADHAANDYLRSHLAALLPAAAWLSEETLDNPARLKAELVFIVDPIDGTRGFIAGDRRWAVSVALVRKGIPILAVLHAPALGETFVAARGRGAWLNNSPIRVVPGARLQGGRIAGPKPFADRLRRTGLEFELAGKIPSLALRFADVAAGRLEAAYASDNAHEWDIAAADLVLSEAGCALVDRHGAGLQYNRASLNHGMLFAAPESAVQAFVQHAQQAGA